MPRIQENITQEELHVGGPVEPGRGFVLHGKGFESDATLEVNEDIRLTATLEILRSIATGKGPDECLIVMGYAGWSAGQLEDEISSNGWLLAEAKSEIIFDPNDSQKYERSLASIGIDASFLSSQSGHA